MDNQGGLAVLSGLRPCPICKQETIEDKEGRYEWCTNTRCSYIRNFEFERRRQVYGYTTPEEFFFKFRCPNCDDLEADNQRLMLMLMLFLVAWIVSTFAWLAEKFNWGA